MKRERIGGSSSRERCSCIYAYISGREGRGEGGFIDSISGRDTFFS